MNADTVELLTSPVGVEALRLAEQYRDTSSLEAATALRAAFPPEVSSAALTQVGLRRQGHAKFGPLAASMLFTRDGLEQATRPAVARHHAARLVAAGATAVVDLSCGIGADAMAFLAAGLDVTAVDVDPATAAVARHNLRQVRAGAGGSAEVLLGDAEQLTASGLTARKAVFCDPSRRADNRRLWRVADFSPSWELVRRLLDGSRPAGVKLGPALPHSLVPAGVHAQWVSHRGDTVEVGLWAGLGDPPDSRAAVILRGDDGDGSDDDAHLVIAGSQPEVQVSSPRRYLYEPDGAVIRAGGIAAIASQFNAALLDRQIAYLTSDILIKTRFATAFEILEVLPYKESLLRQWVAQHEVGTLEIKKRGLEVDPAALRRRVKPRGPGSATVVLTRTPTGAQMLVVRRLADRSGR